MFFRVLSKIFSLYLFRLGEAVLVGVFKKVLFPQRVASEKVRNVRVPRNYFLFTYSHWERPFGESFSKNFLPSKSRQREASFFTPVLNIPSLVPTGSGQKLCLFCNFLPSRGRSRERLKIKPFEKIYLSVILFISILSPRFSNRYVNICNFYMNNLTLSVPIAEDRGCPALLDVCPA